MGRDCRLPCDATRTLAPCEANAWYQRTYHATYLLPWHGGLATHHGEQSNNAYNFMCQLQGLIVQPVMPDFCKYGKCQSLYIQGYHAWTTGLSVKPQFPQQSQLFELMHGLLATRRANLEPLPPVNLCFVDERWPEDMEETYFNERARRSRLAMIKVRKRRKILGLWNHMLGDDRIFQTCLVDWCVQHQGCQFHHWPWLSMESSHATGAAPCAQLGGGRVTTSNNMALTQVGELLIIYPYIYIWILLLVLIFHLSPQVRRSPLKKATTLILSVDAPQWPPLDGCGAPAPGPGFNSGTTASGYLT